MQRILFTIGRRVRIAGLSAAALALSCMSSLGTDYAEQRPDPSCEPISSTPLWQFWVLDSLHVENPCGSASVTLGPDHWTGANAQALTYGGDGFDLWVSRDSCRATFHASIIGNTNDIAIDWGDHYDTITLCQPGEQINYPIELFTRGYESLDELGVPGCRALVTRRYRSTGSNPAPFTWPPACDSLSTTTAHVKVLVVDDTGRPLAGIPIELVLRPFLPNRYTTNSEGIVHAYLRKAVYRLQLQESWEVSLRPPAAPPYLYRDTTINASDPTGTISVTYRLRRADTTIAGVVTTTATRWGNETRAMLAVQAVSTDGAWQGTGFLDSTLSFTIPVLSSLSSYTVRVLKIQSPCAPLTCTVLPDSISGVAPGSSGLQFSQQ